METHPLTHAYWQSAAGELRDVRKLTFAALCMALCIALSALPSVPDSPAALFAAPCIGSGAKMFSAMPLDAASCASSLSFWPFSRMAVMASDKIRMAAMTPASRSPKPARLRFARLCTE